MAAGRRIALGLVLVAAGSTLFPGAARAAFPGANGRIVFIDRLYDDDGNATDVIRTVRADGSGRRTLLRGPEVMPFSPRWSPSGRRLLLATRGNVITADPHGRHRRVVAPFDALWNASWVPDDRRLLFSRPHALDVVGTDGSDPRELLGGLSGNPELPVWSPSGERVAFEIYESGDPTLWIARSDGSRARPVLAGAARPAFSPDGRAIAFAFHDRLWIMRASGRGAHPVTDPAPGEVVFGVAFSPDGRRIAIARQHQVGWIGPSRLIIVNRSDGHQHRLRVGKLVSLPDWQPLPRG